MEWSKTTNVHSTLHICWGAQAGIYYHYGVPKYELPEKLFGVFDHRGGQAVTSRSCVASTTSFFAPHSRYHRGTAQPTSRRIPALELIAVSDEAGVYVAKTTDSRQTSSCSAIPEYDRGNVDGWNTTATSPSAA